MARAATRAAATMTPRPPPCWGLIRAGSPVRAWADHGPAVGQALVRWDQGGSATSSGARGHAATATREAAPSLWTASVPHGGTPGRGRGRRARSSTFRRRFRPKGTGGGPPPAYQHMASRSVAGARPDVTAYPRDRP